MRRVVNRVDHEQRADLMRQAARQVDVIDRAQDIGRGAQRKYLGARGDLGGHIAQVEYAGRQQANLLYDHAAFLQPQPRAAIGLVVELRDEHFIARPQRMADRGAQGVVERGHVLAEGNAACVLGAEKGREDFTRRGQAPIDLLRGPEIAARIDVASCVEVAKGIDHGLRHLTAGGSIEIRQIQSQGRARERRKVSAAAERVFKCEWHSKVCHEIFSAGGSNQGRKRRGVDHPRAGDVRYTPAAGRVALRAAIARTHERRTGQAVDAENVIFLSGAQNALFAASMCVAGPGDEVLALEPLYPSYPATIQASGARMVRVPAPASRGFRPDLGKLEAAITPRTRALFFATPNNPSGVILSEHELTAIGELARRHSLWLVADEVYAGLAPGGRVPSLATRLPDQVVTI